MRTLKEEVREYCIREALSVLIMVKGKKFTDDDVINTAKKFEAYILEQPKG